MKEAMSIWKNARQFLDTLDFKTFLANQSDG